MLDSPALWLLTEGQNQEAQSVKDKESAPAPNKGKIAPGRSPTAPNYQGVNEGESRKSR